MVLEALTRNKLETATLQKSKLVKSTISSGSSAAAPTVASTKRLRRIPKATLQVPLALLLPRSYMPSRSVHPLHPLRTADDLQVQTGEGRRQCTVHRAFSVGHPRDVIVH